MKKQNGITLISLIITIIVMVILAGIALSFSVGENGVIIKAETALRESERVEIEDIVTMSYVYKTVASMNRIVKLDLEGTAKSIYLNMEESKYTLVKTTVGEQKGTYEDIYAEGASSIILRVKGQQANYEGIINENGLVGAIKVVEGDFEDIQSEDDIEGELIELSMVGYIYNAMYNPEQSELYEGKYSYIYGDDNNDKKADKNSNMYAYALPTTAIPVSFFKENVDVNSSSDIKVVITHFDETKETIMLKKTSKNTWKYVQSEANLFGETLEFIFCPYNEREYGKPGWIENDDYHYFDIKYRKCYAI